MFSQTPQEETVYQEFRRNLSLILMDYDAQIYNDFFFGRSALTWLNPLKWIDYSFSWLNKWESAPIIALIRTASDQLAGKEHKQVLKHARTRVMTGERAFETALQLTVDTAVQAANYDASTVVGFVAAFLGRWLWRWWNKATTIQTIRWLIKVIKMPNTEAALIAILEKRLLSVKGLWTCVAVVIFAGYKITVCILSFVHLALLYQALLNPLSTFNKSLLQQKNPLVHDRTLGRRRERTLK